MKKALKWLGIALAALIAVPLALLLIVNLRDEALAPEVAALLQAEPPGVPDEQNAFYYLLGFNAPVAQDPHAAGKAWHAAVNATQEKIIGGAEAPWPAQPGGLAKLARTCSSERQSCIRWLKETPDARKILEDNAHVIRRYRGLHAYPAYLDRTAARVFSYPLPFLAEQTNAQRLFLLDLAQRLERGDVDAVLTELRDDIALNRRMLAGSRTILQKMMAAGHLMRTTLFASDVLTSYREQIGPRAATIAAALGPLSVEERQLAPALRSELITAASAGDPARWRAEDFGMGVNTALLKPFYQHRASMNLLHGFVRAWGEVDRASSAELDAAFARARAAEPQFSPWTAIYNPVGKVLVFSYAPEPAGYFDRIHDTEVVMHLVALHAKLTAARAGPEAAQAHRNPYTGKPFEWDSAKRQLSFVPRSRYVKELKFGGVADRLAVSL